MAKFAPVYMSAYDGPEYVFGTLTLSAATFVTGAAQGTAIGNIGARANADDSALSLVTSTGAPDTTNRFQFDGVGLEVGSAGGALTAGTHTVIVRETNPWVQGEYQDKSFTITVTAE
jgi:hypothetical protein